ncbi:prephenate dehydrogenase [Candidatus Saccharibacteria bacterium]|nr:prephenate dehydrogenase [Candidatus Saccharibacteria bacterium]
MKQKSAGIAVIGVGLIGGSIIRDLQKNSNRFGNIYGIVDDPSASYAKNRGFIHDTLTYNQLPGKVDFIIISSPIFTIAEISQKIHNAFENKPSNKKITIIDVASVKSSIASTFENLTTSQLEFIATHPMAGTEFSGLDHARLGMFKGKPWIISRHKKNTDEGISQVKSFIHFLGGRLKELDAEKHDTYAAAVSHTTILLSNYIFDFLSDRYPEALDLAGSGFDSTTRLASGNPELHNSIMHSNTKTINKILSEFKVFLELKSSVDELPVDYFSSNKEKRDRWLSKKTIVQDKDK